MAAQPKGFFRSKGASTALHKNGAKAPPPPPAEVSVVTVASERVNRTTELPGRINPMREAQVRKRWKGIFATDEARKSVQIALVSEMASEYLTLLQLQESKRIAEQDVGSVLAARLLNAVALYRSLGGGWKS